MSAYTGLVSLRSRSIPHLVILLGGLLAGQVLRAQEPRLANLATRAQAGTGDSVLTAGFVVGGGSKQVVIRAVGPALTSFGLTGLLNDPVLTLVDSAGATVAANDNWQTTDAAVMTAVGAFGLPTGSRDAAIVTTLAPGSYTAQVTGVGGGTGLTIIEVYESGSGAGRLTNISTRGFVGTGADVIIPGIVISPGSGTRRLLIRAAGPALSGFGLGGALSDPTLVVTNATGTQVAANNDWGTPSGTNAATAAQLAATSAQAGAFTLTAGSRDSAVLVELTPGNYSVQISGVGGSTGIALVEIYDVTPPRAATVTVLATVAAADKSGRKPGEFMFTRTGDTSQALTVNYVTSGSAVNGFDYPFLSGSITIPAGESSVALTLAPNPSVLTTGGQTATLSIATSSGTYVVGSPAAATVAIADSPATLYVSSLRPEPGVSGTSASGTATILHQPGRHPGACHRDVRRIVVRSNRRASSHRAEWRLRHEPPARAGFQCGLDACSDGAVLARRFAPGAEHRPDLRGTRHCEQPWRRGARHVYSWQRRAGLRGAGGAADTANGCTDTGGCGAAPDAGHVWAEAHGNRRRAVAGNQWLGERAARAALDLASDGDVE